MRCSEGVGSDTSEETSAILEGRIVWWHESDLELEASIFG